MPAMPDLFRRTAPRLMRDVMRAFDFDPLSAAAIAGNAGLESNGFRTLQEIKPVVPGSRGGYGWFQWTGPRRRAFEAWCAARRLDPKSYEANVGFLIHELKTSEAQAVIAVRHASGLEAKVKAFESAYERAGVKHYAGREQWARWALDAFRAEEKPVNPKPLAKSRTIEGATTAGIGQAMQQNADPIGETIKATGETLAPHTDAIPALGVIVAWIAIIGTVVTLAGLARIAYARWDDGGRPVPSWWPWGRAE